MSVLKSVKILLVLVFGSYYNVGQFVDGAVPPPSFTKPEDILVVEETSIVQLKSIWNLTHITYAMHQTNASAVDTIRYFWNNLKATLSVAVNLIRTLDRKIISSQPSTLLSKLFDLQELDNLQEVSDIITEEPLKHWKVKWIEVSSLATHIHWLFNKRIRDMMNNVPYIKTIANSLAKYYGNPWYSKLSGRTGDAHRYPMRDYPRWIENRTFTIKGKGDLFYGLREMIEHCKPCKAGSYVHRDACLKNQTFQLVEPVHLDAPIYVFFYLCLVDIKFYILKNFFHIYRGAYEQIMYDNYEVFDTRLQASIRAKLEAFSKSFWDYDQQQNSTLKLTKGFFRCDPPPIQPRQNKRAHVEKETFIRLTNFATDFVVLERDLTPSGSCNSTCKTIGKADVAPCRKSFEECEIETYPECESTPRFCELFKPICPLTDLVCWKSATSAKVCPSTSPDRPMEWVLFNNTEILPKGKNQTCSQPLLNYKSSLTKNNEECEVCLCQCLEPIEIRGVKNSVRVFSQKEALALVDANRVVVGIKFEKVDDQIHIMIADAVVKPGMVIDNSTIIWRQPTRADENNPNEVIRIGRHIRVIQIDDWLAPTGFVVTGVRFFSAAIGTPTSPNYRPYIGVKVQVTGIDPINGKLNLSETQWIVTDSPDPKSVYRYAAPDEPTQAEGPAIPDSSVNQIIPFRVTTLLKTNANAVIPYFDSQKVAKGVALKGIGIYHKVKAGYGGFLGWKIMPN